VYVVYTSWKLKNAITESRWILASMYNNLLLLVLLVTVVQNLNEGDETLVYFVVPMILLANTNVVAAVYLPSILRGLKIIKTSSGYERNEKNCLILGMGKSQSLRWIWEVILIWVQYL
jgi:hypothetical protein